MAELGINYVHNINGQNNPSLDVLAVQNAVYQGGKILLKGTFDFGGTQVLLWDKVNGVIKDVEIYGETDNKGNPLTKINGGFWTFYSPLPSPQPTTLSGGPKITIQGIHFQGAIWAPIHIAYSSGTSITDNKITNLTPFQPSGFPFSFSAGIICGPWYLTSQTYVIGAVTGQLKISNNYIDLESITPLNTIGQAIFVTFTTGINAKISENVIENASRSSIEFLDNYLANGTGMIVVEGNEVPPLKPGQPFPPILLRMGLCLAGTR